MEDRRFYRIQNVTSLAIVAFILFLALYVVFNSFTTKNVRLVSDYSSNYNDGWYYLDDTGSRVDIESLPFKIPDSPEEQMIFHDFAYPLEQDLYLDFYTHHQDLSILIDDEEIYSYNSLPRPSWLASYRSIHHFVRIPKGSCGTLKYKVKSNISSHNGEFKEVISGDRLSLSLMIFKERFGKLFLGGLLILMGIFLLFMLLMFNSRESIDKALLNLAFLCLALGAWQIEESRITQLFVGNIAVHWIFEYLVQLAVLIAIFNFIRSITTEQYRLYTNVLFFIVMGTVVVQVLLQLLGIVQLSSSVTVTHVLFFVCIIYGAILVNHRLQFSSKRMKIIFNCSVSFSLMIFLVMLITTSTPESFKFNACAWP